MADVGSFNSLLGENVFSRNNLLPRWERLHNYYVTLYVIFIALFGLSSSVEFPHCLPNDTDIVADMNEGDFAFIDSYCFHYKDGATQLVRFSVLIFALLASVRANRHLEAKAIEASVNVFADAMRTIGDLDVSLEELKRRVVTPNFDRTDSKSQKMRIRKVIKNLVNYHLGDPTNLLLRRACTTVAILFIIFLISACLLVFSFIQLYFFPPYFQCDIDHPPDQKFKFRWNSTLNSTNIYCTRPDTDFDFIVMTLCVAAILGHCEVCWRGLKKLKKIRVDVSSRTNHRRDNYLVASRSMLFLSKMDTDTLEKKTVFRNFVEFIFDKDIIPILERAIPEACGFYGGETDEEFVYIYSYMVDKKRLEDWSTNNHAMLQTLIEERKWKSLVILLNILPEPLVLRNQIRDVIYFQDDRGNNILYYALNRKPGFKEFRQNAAQYILRMTDSCQHIVLQGNCETSASNFIQYQFDKDPTYPEILKEDLQNFTRCN